MNSPGDNDDVSIPLTPKLIIPRYSTCYSYKPNKQSQYIATYTMNVSLKTKISHNPFSFSQRPKTVVVRDSHYDIADHRVDGHVVFPEH